MVGLGNPGAEYAATRHNVGFEVIESLAHALRGRKELALPGGMLEQGRLRGRPLLLLRPMRYMNRSGGPTAEAVRRNELTPKRILVVHDDLDIEIGRMKIRTGGSSGGHNGVQDIIESLGTEAFPRLRIGIGRPPRGLAERYVLEPFEPAERKEVDPVLARAVEAARCWAAEGVRIAMNRYNAASVEDSARPPQGGDVPDREASERESNPEPDSRGRGATGSETDRPASEDGP